jgi:hypothetical protein
MAQGQTSRAVLVADGVTPGNGIAMGAVLLALFTGWVESTSSTPQMDLHAPNDAPLAVWKGAKINIRAEEECRTVVRTTV